MVRFFLAQPPARGSAAAAQEAAYALLQVCDCCRTLAARCYDVLCRAVMHTLLDFCVSDLWQEEARMYGDDMVMLRGEDLYTRLPNKTVSANPTGCTSLVPVRVWHLLPKQKFLQKRSGCLTADSHVAADPHAGVCDQSACDVDACA